MWIRIATTLLFMALGMPVFADCDPNDPVTGLPDLSYSFGVIMINGAPLYNMPALDLHFNSPDLNGDRVVLLHDLPLFSAAFHGAYAFAADLRADGVVDLADIPVLARSMGRNCP